LVKFYLHAAGRGLKIKTGENGLIKLFGFVDNLQLLNARRESIPGNLSSFCAFPCGILKFTV